jgi:hypothetical protein
LWTVNRLKKSCDQTPWNLEAIHHPRQKVTPPDTESSQEHVVIQSWPIATGNERELQIDERPAVEERPLQLDETIETPVVDRNMRRQTPDSSVQDPDFAPSEN